MTDRSYLWPARHQAGSVSDPMYPPMGARFRLATSYDVRGPRPDTQAVLRAMQTYGLILADNGASWFFGGLSQRGWPNAMLDELKTVPASAFEAVDESGLMIDPGQRAGATGALSGRARSGDGSCRCDCQTAVPVAASGGLSWWVDGCERQWWLPHWRAG